jgi:hypothetical protein
MEHIMLASHGVRGVVPLKPVTASFALGWEKRSILRFGFNASGTLFWTMIVFRAIVNH